MRLNMKGAPFEDHLTTVGPMVFDKMPVGSTRKQMRFYRRMLRWGVIVCE